MKKNILKKKSVVVGSVLLASVILGGTVFGVVESLQTRQLADSSVESPLDMNQISNRGIKLAAAQTVTYSVDGKQEYESVLINATVGPADAANKTLVWSVAWKNASSAWASGKTVTDYVTVTPSEDTLSCTVACIQEFGEQIIVKVHVSSFESVNASCIVDYEQRYLSTKFSSTASGSHGFSIGVNLDEATEVVDFPALDQWSIWYTTASNSESTGSPELTFTANKSAVYTKEFSGNIVAKTVSVKPSTAYASVLTNSGFTVGTATSDDGYFVSYNYFNNNEVDPFSLGELFGYQTYVENMTFTETNYTALREACNSLEEGTPFAFVKVTVGGGEWTSSSYYTLTFDKDSTTALAETVTLDVTEKTFGGTVSTMTAPVDTTTAVTPGGGTSTTAATYYGTVSGLGTKAVTFNVSSALSNWTFETFTDSHGTYAKIPTMYKSILTVSDNQVTSFKISDVKEDDTFFTYDTFKNGDSVYPYIGVGTTLFSTSTTVGSARSTARGYGSNYYVYDASTRAVLTDIFMMRFGGMNFNDGSGVSSFMGISGLDNGEWIDGLAFEGANCYVSNDISKYTDSPNASTDGYFKLSYSLATSSNYISALGYDPSHPEYNFPTATGSDSEIYYDYFYNNSSSGDIGPVVCCLGIADSEYGLFYLNGRDSGNWDRVRSGARLCIKPN